jgi:ABC-type dipeptide/oligopeptide/nickel transport system permease subunit
MSTTAQVPSLTAEAIHERQSPTVEALKRLLRHRSAQIGLVLLSSLILVAIFAPVIAPFSPTVPLQNTDRRVAPCIHILGCPASQAQHIMGIDGNFRDLFSRIIFGSRLSLQIGLVTITFAILVGGLLGSIAGYSGGWLDNLIMRTMDVLMAFPSLLLAIAIVTVLGTGLINALLAIGIVSIPIYARLVRASILQIKELDYVSASRALGASNLRLLFTRILPNALTPLIVRGTLGIATAILDAAALSFLGLGAQSPTPEWGLMLGEEKSSIFNAPYLVFFPGLAIMVTVLAFNLLGDGLRDALDPRLRSRG